MRAVPQPQIRSHHGLNETIFVEAARALALRVLREGGSSDESRVQYAYLLCVSRLPAEEESMAVFGLKRRSLLLYSHNVL